VSEDLPQADESWCAASVAPENRAPSGIGFVNRIGQIGMRIMLDH
jgi:hypothetical protein